MARLTKRAWVAFFIGFTAQAIGGELCALQDTLPETNRPNIILINLDDADVAMLTPESMALHFPHLNRFATEGLRLSNLHVTTPLCGPSRAALFVAKYAHRTGIKTNDPFVDRSNGNGGGMVDYGENGFHQNDVSNWMKSAGYRTMMVGKYLHGDTVDIVPEGWDDFYSSRGANYFGTARFTNQNDPQGESRLEPVTTYRTTQEGEEVLMLIDQHIERDNQQPFFLYLAPLAPHNHTPHSPLGMVEEKHKDDWPEALMPLSPDFQEFDFSDKSTAIRDLPMIPERQVSHLGPRHRDRLLSMKSVDDFFANLLAKLETHQLIENTFIILTSDNGFSNGHHRMVGKGDAFNRSTHVPTYVIGPGVPAGETANHLLAHIDLMPTVVELGGGELPADLDGKSFAALLKDPSSIDENDWREAVLIENWETRILHAGEFNTANTALRFHDTVYVEWANGSPEFYDLSEDPYQVENQYKELEPVRKKQLTDLMRTYRKDIDTAETTLSHPFAMNDIHGKSEPLRGMAEASSGIYGVRLTVRRLRDSFYWNGQTWQRQPCFLPAKITNPGQTMTTWVYPEPPAGHSTGELFEVTAAALDGSDNWDSEPAWVVFRMDHSQPNAKFRMPETDGDKIDALRVSGTATDEDAVEHVRLVIRNESTKEYWDGKKWVKEWTTFPVAVKRSGRWKYVIPEAQGSFYVSVRAVDRSGNIQSPPVTRRFLALPDE
ncbi:MAG: sulfatase-like hydrolase/transferase [Pirellulaceae bacterium]|nr:sulfatase-like hydrolase/transferase [Pirellulaceae bacterium]